MRAPTNRPSRVPTARLLLGVLPTLAVAACAWSVPANPGRNALRGTPPPAGARAPVARTPPATSDPGAESIYRMRCGQCHVPYPPDHVEAARWPYLVARYGPRAGLFGAERERVLAWLMANAR